MELCDTIHMHDTMNIPPISQKFLMTYVTTMYILLKYCFIGMKLHTIGQHNPYIPDISYYMTCVKDRQRVSGLCAALVHINPQL